MCMFGCGALKSEYVVIVVLTDDAQLQMVSLSDDCFQILTREIYA